MPMGRKIIFDDDPNPKPAWETALPPLPVEKPWIQLPGDGRTVSAFAQDLGGQLAPHGLYRCNERVLAEDRTIHQSTLLDAPRLVTFVEDYVRCTKAPAPAEGEEDERVVTSMRLSDAKLVLASDRFVNQLQAVEHVNPVRVPVLASADGLRLLPEGVDDKTRIFTERRSLPYRLDLPLDEARALLDGLLAEFPFADAAYAKAVQVAAMLTVYGLDLLPPHCLLPAFAYTANNSGAGKGLLVQLAVLPVFGVLPTTPPPSSEADMAKLLLAGARNHSRVVLLDNVDQLLQSRALESFITATHYSGRLLGQTQQVTYPKKTAVFITGNQLQMRADLRRRTLVVECFQTEARAEDRAITRPLDTTAILARRDAILAALYALVRHWNDDGRPAPSRVQPGLTEWSQVIGGIVEHAGYACPIPPPTAPTLDPVIEGMERLAALLADRAEAATFREVVRVCRANGLFEHCLPLDRDLRDGEKRCFSALLKRYHGMRFRGGITWQLQGHGHARRYLATREAVAIPA
ncbi:MAG: hypothetical protein EBS05_18620 [Proteobacteria bacterium]|nr:hypothetical protein [Pseudomonadota bacterium]